MSKIDERIEVTKEQIENKDFENALQGLEELLAEKLNKKQRFYVVLHIGIVKMNLNRYDESLKDLEHALELAESNQNLFQQTQALHQLGIITKLLGNYDQATELLREELRRCSSLVPSYYSDLSYNFYEQGDVKMLAGEYEDAEMYFNHACTFASTEENYHGVGLAMQALANLKIKMAQPQEALGYLHKSLENFKLVNSPTECEEVEREISNLEQQLGI